MEQLRPIDQKIETARLFVTYFEQLLEDACDKDAREDVTGLLTVACAHLADLQRVQERRKLTPEEWISTRNAKLLAEVIIMELHETEDLSGWFFGCDPGGSMLYAVATFITEAHLQLVESTMKAKNKPLTDEEFKVIERLLS